MLTNFNEIKYFNTLNDVYQIKLLSLKIVNFDTAFAKNLFFNTKMPF